MRTKPETKPGIRRVPVLMPAAMLPQLDRAVERADSDRCKYIRNAVREKMVRDGILHEDPTPACAGRN